MCIIRVGFKFTRSYKKEAIVNHCITHQKKNNENNVMPLKVNFGLEKFMEKSIRFYVFLH